MRSYVGITVCFILNRKSHKAVLICGPSKDHHTAENIVIPSYLYFGLVFLCFSVGCPLLAFSEYFPSIYGLSIAIHLRIHHHFSSWFSECWLVHPLQRPVGFFQLSLSPWFKQPLVTPLVCWLHAHLSKQSIWFFFFLVLDPYKLVISFTAFIHIICCLKIYLHDTMQIFFLWGCFKTNVIAIVIVHDCIVTLFIRNRIIEHVASNRNRLHWQCDRPMSAYDLKL